MKRTLLVLTLVLVLLVPGAAEGSGLADGSSDPTPRAAGKVKCKPGYVRKRLHGEFVCVKAKSKPTPTATPGLDLLASPGTYHGTNGVTVTSATTPEGGHRISMTIAFPAGYVSCPGRPPYPPVMASVADMEVSDLGSFAGTSAAGGAYVQIQGHFTSPNSLLLDSASVSNALARGQRCAAQYTDAGVSF